MLSKIFKRASLVETSSLVFPSLLFGKSSIDFKNKKDLKSWNILDLSKKKVMGD